MGQLCGYFFRRDVDVTSDALGLTEPMREALQGSWETPKSNPEQFSQSFFTWLIETSDELPRSLIEFAGTDMEYLKTNTFFTSTCMRFYEDMDAVVDNVNEPPARQKEVLDNIAQSYMFRGLSETDFQNLAFPMLHFMKDNFPVEPMAEFAWIQAINKISSHMWSYMEDSTNRKNFNKCTLTELPSTEQTSV